MAHDENAPATKKDVQLLMQEMGKLYEKISKLYVANERWKEEIVHEFKVVAENIRHDMIGIHKDKIANHEDRLVRLEQHMGV
jgi:hypothetical protein